MPIGQDYVEASLAFGGAIGDGATSVANTLLTNQAKKEQLQAKAAETAKPPSADSLYAQQVIADYMEERNQNEHRARMGVITGAALRDIVPSLEASFERFNANTYNKMRERNPELIERGVPLNPGNPEHMTAMENMMRDGYGLTADEITTFVEDNPNLISELVIAEDEEGNQTMVEPTKLFEALMSVSGDKIPEALKREIRQGLYGLRKRWAVAAEKSKNIEMEKQAKLRDSFRKFVLDRAQGRATFDEYLAEKARQGGYSFEEAVEIYGKKGGSGSNSPTAKQTSWSEYHSAKARNDKEGMIIAIADITGGITPEVFALVNNTDNALELGEKLYGVQLEQGYAEVDKLNSDTNLTNEQRATEIVNRGIAEIEQSKRAEYLDALAHRTRSQGNEALANAIETEAETRLKGEELTFNQRTQDDRAEQEKEKTRNTRLEGDLTAAQTESEKSKAKKYEAEVLDIIAEKEHQDLVNDFYTRRQRAEIAEIYSKVGLNEAKKKMEEFNYENAKKKANMPVGLNTLIKEANYSADDRKFITYSFLETNTYTSAMEKINGIGFERVEDAIDAPWDWGRAGQDIGTETGFEVGDANVGAQLGVIFKEILINASLKHSSKTDLIAKIQGMGLTNAEDWDEFLDDIQETDFQTFGRVLNIMGAMANENIKSFQTMGELTEDSQIKSKFNGKIEELHTFIVWTQKTYKKLYGDGALSRGTYVPISSTILETPKNLLIPITQQVE